MEDAADSLNGAVLNDFRSAQQCERRPSKHCGWAHVGVTLFTRPTVGVYETVLSHDHISSRRPRPVCTWIFAVDA